MFSEIRLGRETHLAILMNINIYYSHPYDSVLFRISQCSSNSSRVIRRSSIKNGGRRPYHIMIITMRSLCSVKYKVLYMHDCGHAFSRTPPTTLPLVSGVLSQ
jgi:hypothetical protein